jgi:hypothetical protein
VSSTSPSRRKKMASSFPATATGRSLLTSLCGHSLLRQPGFPCHCFAIASSISRSKNVSVALPRPRRTAAPTGVKRAPAMGSYVAFSTSLADQPGLDYLSAEKRSRMTYQINVNRRRGHKVGSEKVEICCECGAHREIWSSSTPGSAVKREQQWEHPRHVILLKRAAQAARAAAVAMAADALRVDRPRDAARMKKLAATMARR